MQNRKRITLADLTAEPHPLKSKIEKAGLTLWQTSKLIGGKPSEAHLSRLLSGKAPMPLKVEQAVIDGLGLENVTVVSERAELIPVGVGPFDWVVSRAVADLDQLAKWCRHLILKPGGRMAVIKGPDLDEEVKRLSKRASAWEVQGWDVRPYKPFEGVRNKESRLVLVSW